jgi:putative sensor protein
MRLLRPFARGDTYRSLAFLLAAFPVAAAALALLIAGWTTTLVLAITPLVIFVLVGFRFATGLLAEADAALARGLLGVDVRAPRTSGGQWFWGRGTAVLGDASFWRQQVYLALRMTLGFALAVAMASMLGAAAQGLTYPIWYRWSPAEIGSWHADTLGRALLFVPVGAAALLVAIHLAGPLGALSGRLASGLLAGVAPAAREPVSLDARRRALAFDALVSAAIAALVTVIWALSGRGSFWPVWVILPLALVVPPRLDRARRAAAARPLGADPHTRLGVARRLLGCALPLPHGRLGADLLALLLAGMGPGGGRSRARNPNGDRVRDATRAARPPGRGARDDALRRGRRPGRRAAADRARSPRRRAGPARRARDDPRPRGAEARLGP